MSFFKDVEQFFSKEVPKFFTKTVPGVFKPETYAPDLIPLRKSVETLKKQVPQSRDRFYEEKAALAKADDDYKILSENFKSTRYVSRTVGRQLPPSLVRDIDDAEKTMRDVAKVSRAVSNFVTLGLAELIYVHADVEEERRELKRQKAILGGIRKRFDEGAKQFASARRIVEGHIKQIKDEMASAGITAGEGAASKMTAAQAQRTARETMAARLLSLETDVDTIVALTGLSTVEIATITPVDLPDEPGSASPDAMMTDEEKAMLSQTQG